MSDELDDLIERLREAHVASTAGEWTFEACNEIIAGEDNCDAMLLGGDGETIVAQCLAERDWPFIALAHNAMPALLDALASYRNAKP